MPETAHPAYQATAWDRAAITVLGGAGCALSYDALQQMATAIHVRHALTYLFPAVIDGFIAYGVRALLVLRRAPFRARLYAWALFATATTASIWANALHAVRLNQQTHQSGLHLDDTTVGILSTLAPLALAGAVHLHILITRHSTPALPHPPNPTPAPAACCPVPDLVAGSSPEPTSAPAAGYEPEEEFAFEPLRPSDQPREPDPQHDKGTTPTPTASVPVRRIGRPPSAELGELIDLVRPVFSLHENPTRAMVREHVRAGGHTLSEDRLTHVMHVLRHEREAR